MKHVIRRGQPVISLALLLTLWVGARTALLASADADLSVDQPAAVQVATEDARPALSAPRDASPSAPSPGAARAAAGPDWPHAAPPPAAAPPLAPIAAPPVRGEPIAEPEVPNPFRGQPRLSAGHQMLWLAALAQLPLPPEAKPGAASAAPPNPSADRDTPRWSADGWLLLRKGGSGSGALGAAPASYGASQAGAVIRYALAPSSALDPKAYLRVSSAVRSPHDAEAAVGLALRPVKGLPVAAMAELRVTQLGGGTALRPAALLVSEFPPLPLPAGFRAESYGAAGYVGGRFATPFAEGQLRIERPIARLGRAELRAGGGAWGGAQKGANRLDAGPSATLGFPLGAGNGRLSADWRFRLTGNAAPQSGPALTISAGF